MINFFAVTSDAIEYLILSLYIACHEGYLDIVKLLIERSADVIISIIAWNNGQTPMHYAMINDV